MELSDVERKVLQIINNHAAVRGTLTIKKLCVYTGRKPLDMVKILDSLMKKGYLKLTTAKPEARLFKENGELDLRYLK